MNRAKKYHVGLTREFLMLMIVLVVLVPASSVLSIDFSNPRDRTATVGRPNIVLITMDDMRADELRYMSNVLALAEHGFKFRRAYSTLPQCCPARASLLTGQYAHNHGVMSNHYKLGGGYEQFVHVVDPDDTLGVKLQRAGYRTSYIGKYLNRYGKFGAAKTPEGWDNWRGIVGRSVMSYDQQVFSMNGERVVSSTSNTITVTDLAIQDMRVGKDPFFVWLNYLAPHSGYTDTHHGTPLPLKHDRKVDIEPRSIVEERQFGDKSSYVARQGRLSEADRAFIARNHAARVRSLIGVDRKIGRMVEYLEATGQLDDTVIIFHSDNGFLMGEHGFRAGKNVPYEPSVKVPLVLAGPEVPVGRSSTMVTLHDVSVTIMDMAGVKVLSGLDGVSLQDILADESSYRDRPVLYESGPTFNNTGLGMKTDRGTRFFTAIHYRRWVYIRYHDGQHELYDLRRDPDQLHSLHKRSEYAHILHSLREELRRLKDCKGTECNRRFELSR